MSHANARNPTPYNSIMSPPNRVNSAMPRLITGRSISWPPVKVGREGAVVLAIGPPGAGEDCKIEEPVTGLDPAPEEAAAVPEVSGADVMVADDDDAVEAGDAEDGEVG